MQFQPKIPQDKLHSMFERLKELTDYTNPETSIVEPYETTVINYGGSEHFIYDAQYLDELFKETAWFFNNVNTKRNVLAFSSSGLMNADKMEEKAKAINKHLHKDQFVVDFVIDMARFEKLKDRYQANFKFFREQFGFIDLAINLESNSLLRDWDAFSQFIDQNGILNIDLIYSINKNNKNRVQLETNNIFNIYEKIVQNTKGGKGLFDLHNLLRIKEHEESLEDVEIFDLCKSAAHNILKDAIFIDSNFNVYPALFVIFADVPLNERAEIPPIGNLFDTDFKSKFNQYETKLTHILFKTFSTNKHCQSCPLNKECYQTGTPILNKFINNFKDRKVSTFEDCENPVKSFLIAKHNKHLILEEDKIE